MSEERGNLLFVSNFAANAGYAWDYFERLFAAISDRLERRGVRTFVAYPSIPGPPKLLEDCAAEPIELDASLDSRVSRRATARFVREHEVDVVYYIDRPTWRVAHLVLRWSGVRHIIAADCTSGDRTIPRGVKRWLKWVMARLPGVGADRVVTPSEYVARRQIQVAMNPSERVTSVHHGYPLVDATRGDRTHDIFGVDPGRPIVGCACRAAPEKGLDHLLRAFDQVRGRMSEEQHAPVLVYLGDGPQMPELRRIRESLPSRDDIILGGYRSDAVRLLKDASVFAMPSVWQEAFGLSVVEPMSFGKPVIGTRVGGIPEIIVDGETGVLIPPGDEAALADALESLLRDPIRTRELGRRARERVAEHFSPEREIDELTALIERGFGIATE